MRNADAIATIAERPMKYARVHRRTSESSAVSAIEISPQSTIRDLHPMPQFIYTMKGLGKVHPPDTQVLDDIWLSFYFGAKIGVLGLNGAGKSSLLKIMAGEDTSFIGEAFPADGISIGFLHQEPRLDPKKTVLGNVEEGVAPIKALLARYDEVNAQARRGSVARGNGQGPRGAGRAAGQDRRGERMGPRFAARAGDGRAAPAAARRRCDDAVGRRTPPCRAVPAAAAVARPAVARRADQPSRRRVGRLARALSEGVRRHGRRGHARPLFPRQRRRLDSRARSRPRHSRGRATIRRGSSRSRTAWRRKRRPKRAASRRSSASWNGSGCRRAPGRPRARRV